MPVKEVKSPKAKATTAASEDSPWEFVDGEKKRVGRKLRNENKIHQFIVESADMLSLVDQFSATAILKKSEELAYGYAKLAEEDPRVKRIINMMTSSSAYAAAGIPTLTILVAIAWHHGFMPDRIGMPVAMMQDLPPVTRAEMNQARENAAQEGREAAAAAAANGSADAHPRGKVDGNDS